MNADTERHIFTAGSRTVICGHATTANDLSVKEYDLLEYEARSGSYMGSLHADRALAKVCKLCAKLYESTK